MNIHFDEPLITGNSMDLFKFAYSYHRYSDQPVDKNETFLYLRRVRVVWSTVKKRYQTSLCRRQDDCNGGSSSSSDGGGNSSCGGGGTDGNDGGDDNDDDNGNRDGDDDDDRLRYILLYE